MVKLLSEVKWDNLRLNDRVKLIKSGTLGHIGGLSTPEECPLDEENTITIDWDNGGISYFVYHSWLDKVEYLGRKLKS